MTQIYSFVSLIIPSQSSGTTNYLSWLQKEFNKSQILILVASTHPQSNKQHYVSEVVIR